MRVLAVGDVVSENGVRFLRDVLPGLKREKKIDLCIVNGENSDVTNAVTPFSADQLFSFGTDVITTGNHVFRKKEIYNYLDETPYILRPANFKQEDYGRGFTVIDMGRYSAAVINLMGVAFMGQAVENPFLCIDRILEETADCKIRLLDFHADATGEKRAMGFYLDGKVSAMFGTHTHIQTADEDILPRGTGYITDLGMVGARDSCLGVKPEYIIARLRDGKTGKLIHEQGRCIFGGCVFEIDEKTGLTVAVERVLIRE